MDFLSVNNSVCELLNIDCFSVEDWVKMHALLQDLLKILVDLETFYRREPTTFDVPHLWMESLLQSCLESQILGAEKFDFSTESIQISV